MSTSVVTDYTVAVENFNTELGKPEVSIAELEDRLLQALTARDALHSAMQDQHYRLSANEIEQVFHADKTLFYVVKRAMDRHNLNPAKWRYLMPDPANLGWWWRLDKNPVRRDDEIVYESQIPFALFIGILLFAVGFGIALLTTQQLWAKGLDLLGYLNLGIQVLVGGGLITEAGQKTALRLFREIVQEPGRLFNRLMRRETREFTLEVERRGGHVGILAAAIVFLTIIVVTTGVLLPWAARQMHQLGVEAIKRQDTTGAQLFLDLAVQLQPDFLKLFQTDVTVDLAQLGNLYYDGGNIEKAQETYERALANDSANVTVHYHLAEIYINGGEYDRAILLLDQAVNLLNDHRRGAIQLALPDENQVIELLYLSLLIRARAYYEGYGPVSARDDLVQAKALTDQYPDLFLSPERPQQQTGRRTTELYVMLARVYTAQFYASSCQDNFAQAAIDEWTNVLRSGFNERISLQRLWQTEAADTQTKIRNRIGCE